MSTQLENSINEQFTLVCELIQTQMKRNSSYVPPIPPWQTSKRVVDDTDMRRHKIRNAKDLVIEAVFSMMARARSQGKVIFDFTSAQIYEFSKERFTYSRMTINVAVDYLRLNNSYEDMEGRRVRVRKDKRGYRNLIAPARF